jgi:hypothetical protein
MSRPNLEAAMLCAEKNLDYLQELLAMLAEEEAKRRKLLDEKEL